MIARELIDTAQVPGGEELRLFRHGGDFMIVLDRNELMSTRMSGSEEALATMSIERIAGHKAPHLLIGGYGMGFTLRAALEMLGKDATITVAELVPKIIEWARGPMAELAAGCLERSARAAGRGRCRSDHRRRARRIRRDPARCRQRARRAGARRERPALFPRRA